jgi:hypothetical protein
MKFTDGSKDATGTDRSGDRRVLRRIAGFFDDEGAALRLLRRYYRSGCILVPEGKTSLDDFYRLQRAAWARRDQSGVPHSISILEKCFRAESTNKGSFFGGTSEPFDLDNIEGRRDFDGQYEARYGKYGRD